MSGSNGTNGDDAFEMPHQSRNIFDGIERAGTLSGVRSSRAGSTAFAT